MTRRITLLMLLALMAAVDYFAAQYYYPFSDVRIPIGRRASER